jgi:hypothetical protein
MQRKIKSPTLHSPLVIIGAMFSMIAADQWLQGTAQSVVIIVCLATIVIGIFLNLQQHRTVSQSNVKPQNITKFDFVLARYRSTVKAPKPSTATIPANIVALSQEKSAQIEG